MNDFTKEELITLYDIVKYDAAITGSNKELADKIFSMIENYCEHKNEELEEIIYDCSWENSWQNRWLKSQAMIDDQCEHEWNYNQHGIPIDCSKCGECYR